MEIIKNENQVELKNPGIISKQLLSPHNSTSERVTITEVSVDPGSSQPRHIHESSEQIWIAIEGSAKLLVNEDNGIIFNVGDVARFADKDIHGLKNDSKNVFKYISVTSPPINFNYAYKFPTRTTGHRKNQELSLLSDN